MEFRSAQKIEGGAIDCEVNHPIHGWIPFTAIAGDTGAEFDVDDLISRMSPIAADIVPIPQSVIDAQIIEQDNNEARGFLQSTDWYVIRNQETGAAIPVDVVAARASARNKVK